MLSNIIKRQHNTLFKACLLVLLITSSALANAQSLQYFVSTEGSDQQGDGSKNNPWQTLQKALQTIPLEIDAADINLLGGTHILSGGLYIGGDRGGSASGRFRIRSNPGELAIIDGRNVAEFSAMLVIANAHYITLQNLTFTNLTGNKSGIYISGSSSNIHVDSNVIFDMHWTTDPVAAQAPQPSDNLNPVVVLGNSVEPMRAIAFTNNTLYELTTGYSEAVKIVGNVDGFLVENNTVRDVTNICIVAAGNYSWVGLTNPELNHARNGIIRNNQTLRCISPIASSAGIYADGARNILIQGNHSKFNTVGFSVGCEQPGDASGITLIGNLAAKNTEAGLVIGTFSAGAIVKDVLVTGNKFRRNFTNPVWGGAPVIFSNAESVTVSHNKLLSTSQYMLTANGNVSNLTLNRNTYKSTAVDADQAVFAWVGINGVNYFSFDAYRTATGQDSLSRFRKIP